LAKQKSRAERLFGAAVLRRSFELQDRQYEAGFKLIYEGVLRDLDVTDDDVVAYLAEHQGEVDRAIGRRGRAKAKGPGEG
jgi:hypothetical protein